MIAIDSSLDESKLTELQYDAWERLWFDISQRAKPGIFLYPAFWVAIALGSGIHQESPVVTWGVAAVFFVVSFGRLIHFYRFATLTNDQRQTWTFWMFAGVLVHGFLYGAGFAYSLISTNTDFNILMAFSGAGIIAGAVNSFAPKRSLAMSYVAVFMAPAVFLCCWIGDRWIEIGLFICYACYMFNLLWQQHREYWASLKNELALERQSRTDALTDLKNRRYFDEKLSELCHLSSRDHVQIAVLVIDCDHFKTINDQYGHDFGDQCLRQLAKILTENLPRATDVCARYGGEEFSVILAGTDLAGAKLVAERIRKSVEKREIIFNGKSAKLTVSIGLVAMYLPNFDRDIPERLFKYADEALYIAKEQGRNRVVCSAACSSRD